MVSIRVQNMENRHKFVNLSSEGFLHQYHKVMSLPVCHLTDICLVGSPIILLIINKILTNNLVFFFFIFLLGLSIGTSKIRGSAFLFPGDIDVIDDVTETDPGELGTKLGGKTGCPTGEKGSGEGMSSNP